jgi:hypothetical protein
MTYKDISPSLLSRILRRRQLPTWPSQVESLLSLFYISGSTWGLDEAYDFVRDLEFTIMWLLSAYRTVGKLL